jgi:hypothetical protein
LSAELKQKVAEDRNKKQKKAKGFRGLQPQERPLILPGGRKWRNAKDAMNEEMIAEIISSQAELIMGSTLGYVLIFNLITLLISVSLPSIILFLMFILSLFMHSFPPSPPTIMKNLL